VCASMTPVAPGQLVCSSWATMLSLLPLLRTLLLLPLGDLLVFHVPASVPPLFSSPSALDPTLPPSLLFCTSL